MLNAFQKHLLGLVDGYNKSGSLRYFVPNTENQANKKFLLAVSGGLDSVVMTELFRLSGYNFSIAHCNFQLREKDSDEDLKFVKKLAGKTHVPFYSVNFETEKYCSDNKISIQMGARQLRYKWLEKVRDENELDYIVTAHHADDSVETFFINLFRGTGISGLHGIKDNHDNIIRPLLTFYRKEIEDFAKENRLKWREDTSNGSDKYERNRIRKYLIPAIEKVSADAKKQVLKTMTLLSSSEDIYREKIETITSHYVKKNKDGICVNLNLLIKERHGVLYLYEIIKKFGFNYSQAIMIDECLTKKEHSGKIFMSKSHRILIDRDSLWILPMEEGVTKSFSITSGTSLINLNGIFCSFRKIKKAKKFKPETSTEIASLDLDKLSFPLKVRKWKNGDRFFPLGMDKHKKVSDFLIDNKVSLGDKEKAYVLESKGKIVWLIGYRIDERFKITTATKNVYLCWLKTQ